MSFARQLFDALSSRINSGRANVVHAKDFQEAVQSLGADMESDERVQEVMLKCSIDGDGYVDFSKFADAFVKSRTASEGTFFRLPWGNRTGGGISEGEAAPAPAPTPELAEDIHAPEVVAVQEQEETKQVAFNESGTRYDEIY